MSDATPNGGDAVEHGIREWQRTREERDDAIERARMAEQEAIHLRAQNELFAAQKKQDDARIRTLQAHLDEADTHLKLLGEAVLSLHEKRQAGHFRRAGSVENGGERLRSARAELVPDGGARAEDDGGETGDHGREDLKRLASARPAASISGVVADLGRDLESFATRVAPDGTAAPTEE